MKGQGTRVDTRTHSTPLTIYVSAGDAPWIRRWNPHATVVEASTPPVRRLRGL